MPYINIPYVTENNRIERQLVAKELELLKIGEASKGETLDAIYHLRPRGVDLPIDGQAELVGNLLGRLGIPFRQTDESEYK